VTTPAQRDVVRMTPTEILAEARALVERQRQRVLQLEAQLARARDDLLTAETHRDQWQRLADAGTPVPPTPGGTP
jgi:hypothetical protein